MMKEKHGGSYVIATILSILWLGINYYLYFPALNVHSQGFWFWLMFHSVIISGIYILAGVIARGRNVRFVEGVKENASFFRYGKGKVQLAFLVLVPVACVLVLVIGNLTGAKFFHAKRYAKLLTVENREFTEDIPEAENVDNIALMDTNSARIFGNRKIGSLSDVVSQFEVEDEYTQINIGDKPMKVANLQYAGFFKYLSNRGSGIPGYIEVNPVNSDSEYVKLEKGMRYVASGYFNDNIYRYVQMHYPTKIISDCYFEVNDDGNPFYVCPVLHAQVGLFGGMDVKGAVLCDPVTGDMQYYAVKDIPSWVDRVYDGELLERKFDWYGTLSNGFWNSIVGQKGCIQTTDDYGYKTLEDDVWIYTGVTSVTGDASNVGFVMINQRTSEARYYSISGAEEYSAMSSAEGEVQEKNYSASFPSLINVDGEPTYIMVLTDNGGLVKMYAMVNVEQYNLVVTAESQDEVFAKYKKLLASNSISGNKGTDAAGTLQEKEFVVSDIEFITIEGETYTYIKDETGDVYKQKFSEDESLIKISMGDTVFVQYEERENGIHSIVTAEIVKKENEKGQNPIPEEEPISEKNLTPEEESISEEDPTPEEESISGKNPTPEEETISEKNPTPEEESISEKDPVLEEKKVPEQEIEADEINNE